MHCSAYRNYFPQKKLKVVLKVQIPDKVLKNSAYVTVRSLTDILSYYMCSHL